MCESFEAKYPPLALPPAELKLRRSSSGKPQVLCLSRRRYVALTPEEWVRQHFMAYMVQGLGFPQSLVAAEIPVSVNGQRQRADIVAFSRAMEPMLIVECKAPAVPLSQVTLNQACRYLSALGSRAVVLTNGLAHYCIALSASGAPTFVPSLPTWQQLCGSEG